MPFSNVNSFNLPVADCHFHIVDPQRFPFSEEAGYRPKPDETGTLSDFLVCMESHGVDCGLAVQPSGYGYSNAALLDSIGQADGRLKGIAVVQSNIADSEMQELKDAGIVGVRFNLVDFDPTGLAAKGVRKLLERIREIDWFVEVQCNAGDFIKIESGLRRTGVRVLIDHMGRPDPRAGVNQVGFSAIVAMADTGRAAVKLSGAFRESYQAYPYRDLDPFVEVILEAFTPDNCIWGSDWPFLNINPKIEYRQTLNCLERWLPDEDQRRKVMWDTPARLFNFSKI